MDGAGRSPRGSTAQAAGGPGVRSQAGRHAETAADESAAAGIHDLLGPGPPGAPGVPRKTPPPSRALQNSVTSWA